MATYMEKTMRTKYQVQVRSTLPETHWLAPYTTPCLRKELSISSSEPCSDRASEKHFLAFDLLVFARVRCSFLVHHYNRKCK